MVRALTTKKYRRVSVVRIHPLASGCKGEHGTMKKPQEVFYFGIRDSEMDESIRKILGDEKVTIKAIGGGYARRLTECVEGDKRYARKRIGFKE